MHANIEAMSAVIDDMSKAGVDKRIFLGDIVGYGPNPNECIELLLKTADFSLGGNHDWAMVDKTPTDYFNPFARQAVDWTISVLKEEHKDFLKRTEASAIYDDIHLAHSSPKTPEDWRYILSYQEAEANYPYLERPVCFIGHSHQPVIIEYSHDGSIEVVRDKTCKLADDKKYIINIGSVGQPRDGNIESCYVIYDLADSSIEFRRVGYDISIVQRKMREADLPAYLIERLSSGK